MVSNLKKITLMSYFSSQKNYRVRCEEYSVFTMFKNLSVVWILTKNIKFDKKTNLNKKMNKFMFVTEQNDIHIVLKSF